MYKRTFADSSRGRPEHQPGTAREVAPLDVCRPSPPGGGKPLGKGGELRPPIGGPDQPLNHLSASKTGRNASTFITHRTSEGRGFA